MGGGILGLPYLSFLAAFSLSLGQVFDISQQEAEKIANGVWMNESRGSIQGLTCWNQGEEFASLGIGHFIWYPPDVSGRFKETFPSLIAFLGSEGVCVPAWIQQAKGCPWPSKEAFDANINSGKMQELRQFLYETRALQALFIVNRLDKSLEKLVEGLSPHEKEHVQSEFNSLLASTAGGFALIDYLNFKGEGISDSEEYQGYRWGLKQVLLRMNHSDTHPVVAFVAAAKQILAERVRHAPESRGEERWLKGWFNRLDTYTKAPF